MKFLFDLGGVFFDWNPDYFYKNIIKNNEKRKFFLKNICNENWNIKQDKGRLIKDAERQLITLYPNFKKEILMYYPNHRKMIRRIFNESVNILNLLKELKFECYVLSNWSSETFVGIIDEYPFMRKFNGIIISGNEKKIKPDRNIYQLAIERFNLIPNQTVFIDDKKENINTAKEIGFISLHLKDPTFINAEINRLVDLKSK